jgi:hypothetical protein
MMISRMFVMGLLLCLCNNQAIAMKRSADAQALSPSKKKRRLHGLVERDDLYNFWVQVAFDDADVDETGKNSYPLSHNIAYDWNMSDSRKDEFLTILIQNGINVDAQSSHTGFSLLHYAASKGNVPLIKQLISAGADPKIEDNGNRIPLDYLGSMTKAGIEQIDVIEAFADTFDPAHVTVRGNSLLHNAGLDTQATAYFVLKGVPFEQPNKRGETAYQYLERKSELQNENVKDMETVRKNIIEPALVSAATFSKREDCFPGMQASLPKLLFNRQYTGTKMFTGRLNLKK